MITTLLVANRGEIACRVFRTCRDLGIATVAVHSDADAGALHVREADAAVRLPGDAPADTYLRGDLIIEAALAAGADAIHPGYGFLAENADFARQVTEAGLTWIGPPPAAIEAMASKTRAKELLGIAPLDPTAVTETDLPVIVKAAAGGGGRGMRVVRELADLPAELTAASAEAASAFGDGEVFVEPYIEAGRHVEVQILADTHGTVWTLGTRDCSLQRRHQKVIEEAPAPGGPWDELYEQAAAIAKTIGYTGAGTVEFLVPPTGRAQFLEVNTRLQVEHPVTELVYGVDLVALQLSVAEGTPLPAEPPEPQGHAVEARLYAEDPASAFAPQTGVLHRLAVPTGVRLDTGYADGDAVTPYYDAMLAKVIVHAPTRAEAVRRLTHALRRTKAHGPATNRDLLVRSLTHPEFTDGRTDTGFYDRHLTGLTTPADGTDLAALAAALADAAGRATAAKLTARIGGWRNVPSQAQTKTYSGITVRYRLTRDGQLHGHPGVRLLSAAPHRVVLEVNGVSRAYDVAAYPDGTVHVDTPQTSVTLRAEPRFTDPSTQTAPGSLLAPMPGTVVRIADGVAPGAAVVAGQPLLWLEAMKMEHRVTAPAAGTLTALHAEPGRQVQPGALLAVIEETN
ncbi:Acetyl-/propionyl-coenzyme A carboxylase alpha chain [Streptomyces sp. RB5]|uniref:Acetyl-/propionyl-coenzyme A carboxylase alpha chain n=1 Tax=Streptomyces smaragdinus TaxID=2585196 RepID=A0A7K0CHQ1_9ACTN|nr:biotin carboxylase N-terminal domain-containing protein [Streptomyces smaragdinus]MQY12998.1 Acetyl-/propionyl-coenzyme A carboxylase alpha chain [Streptomyces smaragdinus]